MKNKKQVQAQIELLNALEVSNNEEVKKLSEMVGKEGGELFRPILQTFIENGRYIKVQRKALRWVLG